MLGVLLVLVTADVIRDRASSTRDLPGLNRPAPTRSVDGVRALQADVAHNPHEVALGRDLFFDRRLSADGTVSCASCHRLDTAGGADGLPVSVGIGGQAGTRNAPTVFNAALNFRQFWDGRADSLEDQIDGPINSPVELGTSWPDVIARLSRDDNLRARIESLYQRPIDAEAIKTAIAAFERTLITVDAPFDRWLRGERDALSDSAQQGWQLFRGLGCIACHQGANLGGNLFERFGLVVPRDAQASQDPGRFAHTGDAHDLGEFKVPGLRNVARTAPYFHDGSVATLDEAVRLMAWHQLGLRLDPGQTQHLVSFLESLTGHHAGQPL